MAYDRELAERVRRCLAAEAAITERAMFGGLAFMQHGNMVCGILGDGLLVRTGSRAYEDALARPHVRPMAVTGRPMRGMVIVDSPGLIAEADLAAWVAWGLRFVSTLPAKG